MQDLKTKARIAKDLEIIAEKLAADAVHAFSMVQIEQNHNSTIHTKMTADEIRAERFKKANEVAAAIVRARQLLYAEAVISAPDDK